MILGGSTSCFEELDQALVELQRARGDGRAVVLNASAAPSLVPEGSIVYNLDLPGIHFDLGTMRALADRASEVWDFSARGAAQWRAIGVDAKHVPVGYHPSMTRFVRVSPPVFDVVFGGSMNDRRHHVMRELRQLAVRELERQDVVVTIAPTDRAERDWLLARARCSLNMLFYDNGVYPMLRAAHLLANDVPFVLERCPEVEQDPTSSSAVDYRELAAAVLRLVRESRALEREGFHLLGGRKAFEKRPMVLP